MAQKQRDSKKKPAQPKKIDNCARRSVKVEGAPLKSSVLPDQLWRGLRLRRVIKSTHDG